MPGFRAVSLYLVAALAALPLAPVQRVTGYDVVMPLGRLEHQYLPDVQRILEAARKTLEDV